MHLSNEKEIDGKIIKTRKYQKHIPNSYGLKYNCIHDIYSKPVEIFNSSDSEVVCKNFIERLEELAKYSHFLTQQFKTKINFIADEKQWHNKQTTISYRYNNPSRPYYVIIPLLIQQASL